MQYGFYLGKCGIRAASRTTVIRRHGTHDLGQNIRILLHHAPQILNRRLATGARDRRPGGGN